MVMAIHRIVLIITKLAMSVVILTIRKLYAGLRSLLYRTLTVSVVCLEGIWGQMRVHGTRLTADKCICIISHIS
jgi:hypothetical protein